MHSKCRSLVTGVRVDMETAQDLDPTGMDTTAMVSIHNMYFGYLGAFTLGLFVQNLKHTCYFSG